MYEVIFLFVLAFIWIAFAVVQDLKKREISNWLNFSLIIFALVFRFFYSVFSENFNFFFQGLIGFGIFLVLGNIFYYGRVFAGGDAKLMIALGAVLPFSNIFLDNLKIFILFLILFLFFGAFYGLIWSVVLTCKNFRNFKKEFAKQLEKNKFILYSVILVGFSFIILSVFLNFLSFFGLFLFLICFVYLYAKSVDEVCMVKKIKTSDLTEGDWLYKDLKLGRKIIKANWEGLSENEIKLIKKKYKIVLIRQGIPFAPVFLISFLVLFYLWATGLWNSFWQPYFFFYFFGFGFFH